MGESVSVPYRHDKPYRIDAARLPGNIDLVLGLGPPSTISCQSCYDLIKFFDTIKPEGYCMQLNFHENRPICQYDFSWLLGLISVTYLHACKPGIKDESFPPSMSSDGNGTPAHWTPAH
ncbi:hypothetical protein OUZ56_020731 [Daphnia magna]|uniref:Uncharacterized protein n=1 Tax=Daphnia magna TaxID=35525 RepID=A0ABQ9ZFH1_9CRUS|nr:hypothetical protein OUZ56_020731 [Daphnia magna]